jgi:riboflavin kinase/FMN adenylyltransferase
VQRWRGLDAVPPGWGRSVVIVGVFDGVHRGHQQLIRAAVTTGRARGLPTVLVTFDPHPAEVVRPGSHPARLTSLRRRADIVAELGVDAFLVMPFTTELSRKSPAEFAHEVLVDRLHAAVVLVGANFTFGHRAAGTVSVLTELGTRFGFAVEGIALATDGTGDHVTFSSTYVRACIDAGDVEAAAAALGRPHRVEGVVVHGYRRGRSLGFPTANIATPPYTALPADGVYAGLFVIGGRRLPAAISVGSNPTFSGTVRTVEAYVLDVDEDFYGHEVGVDFVARLRGQERYDDLDELVAAIQADVVRTRDLLGVRDP